MSHPNKVAEIRRIWELSQEELGLLLDMSRQGVSRIETSAGSCPIDVALTLEILFDVPVVSMFPELHTALYEALLPRLAAFSVLVEQQTGAVADRKRALMHEFAERASPLAIAV